MRLESIFSFKDRQTAAHQLLPLLEKFKGQQGVVLAIPRGGVPIGRIIADALDWPLEPLMIKKIGHPENPEYAIGAVSETETFLTNGRNHIPEAYLISESARLQRALKERRLKFMDGRLPSTLVGKTVLVVDDGVATGKTILAAIRLLRKKNPVKIVVVVPVAAAEAARNIRNAADELVCIETPEQFYGVGQFYESFPQVEDEEVKSLLD